MKNIFKLIWSDEAVEGLKEIIAYLENKFSEKEVEEFVRELDHQLNTICTYPGIFPKSVNLELIRRCIVAKRTSIYYTVEGDKIILITITDNRKNQQL